MESTDDDKHVFSLYQKAIIQDEQERLKASQDIEKNISNNLVYRLQRLFIKLNQIYQDPKISKQQLDTAERGLEETLDTILIHTHPRVMQMLTLEALRNQSRAKIIQAS